MSKDEIVYGVSILASLPDLEPQPPVCSEESVRVRGARAEVLDEKECVVNTF
jgi:hypothetical protein